MHYCITLVLACILAINSFGQSSEKSIPSTWGRDFVIEFSYTGSMDGSHTGGKMTYDSCIIVYQAGHKAPVRGSYLMKENDRNAILKKLREFKAEKIQSEGSKVAVDDGYSRFIRIGNLYVSSGPSYEMTEDSRLRFGEVYHYLEGFALMKTNPK
ncbi:hypothetical protein WBG78_03140 [Chryseolinea sp. T2]|uniref:hypothetical protein n=1 Tax=Chryseolinea sp. T2 TaxID=3129255 RepID=UPI00307847FC